MTSKRPVPRVEARTLLAAAETTTPRSVIIVIAVPSPSGSRPSRRNAGAMCRFSLS
ncbi:hypothetical protein AB0D11_41545 [Streptomyces monashensis]|uniref:hypothetical protein n=1 Tax=Streptomyces monashensis TaxID=1678012 RepID=UPI0033D90B17